MSQGLLASIVETKEPHASTPSNRHYTLDYFCSGHANLKIAALASNSLVKFQTEVPTKIGAKTEKIVMFADAQQVQDLYTQHIYGPVEQCNLMAEVQSNRFLRPYFSVSSGLLSHRNLDSSFWY